MAYNKFDIQANILKSHKNKVAVHISFRWKRTANLLTEKKLKVARLSWLIKMSKFLFYTQEDCVNKKCFITGLYFSKFGYDAIDLPEHVPVPFFPNIRNDGTYNSRPFAEKMNYRRIFDREKNLYNYFSDGLIIVSAKNENIIREHILQIFDHENKELFDHDHKIEYWGVRETKKDENGKDYSVGPLGFKDGISNPKNDNEIFNSAIKVIQGNKGNFILGSYVAFILIHILEEKFQKTVSKISKQLKEQFFSEINNRHLSEKEINDKSKALLMGRHEDGTPLCAHGDNCDENKLNFHNDPNAYHCPLRSHVRSFNRSNGSKIYESIVRRGIVWRSKENLEKKIGLIFLSYHRDLKTQLFDSIFNSFEGNRDFIVYTSPNSRDKIKFEFKFPQFSKIASISLVECDLDFKGYGGEAYYFAPSKPFYNQLENYLRTIEI